MPLDKKPFNLVHVYVPGMHRRNLIVEAGEMAFMFGDQPQLEFGLVIPQDVDAQ